MSWSQKHTHTYFISTCSAFFRAKAISWDLCVCVCMCVHACPSTVYEKIRGDFRSFWSTLWSSELVADPSVCWSFMKQMSMLLKHLSCIPHSFLPSLSHTLLIRERNSVFWENHDFIVSVIVIASSKLSFKKKCGKMSTSWKQTPASLVNVLSTDCYVHYLKL